MNAHRLHQLVSLGGIMLLLSLLAGPVTLAQPDTITLTVAAPAYRLEQRDDATTIDADGCTLTGEVGQVLMPHQLIDVALPPDVDWDSLALTVRDVQARVLPGAHQLPVRPQPWPHGSPAPDPALDEPAVPPPPVAAIAAAGQMRKWHLARVDFCPFQYDEATGQLRVIEQATVELHFARTGEAPSAELLADTALDDEAAHLFANYAQARAWYPRVDRTGLVTYDYVIMTTNAIQANSTKLSAFVAHKQSRGYNVLVVTESAYGPLTGQAPNGRAEKVRQWLMNTYAAYGIRYVLLIGDPTPEGTGSTDLPMKMCHPRHNSPWYPYWRESPTDYFFADLTGNWNKDGDSYFGEWGDDTGGGGIDYIAEVYVGRIPFYDNYDDLDHILQKTIDYERQANATWRTNVLFPMSFVEPGYDDAALAEQVWDDHLHADGFSRWRQYQQGTGPCPQDNSVYDSEEALRGDTMVRDRWAANRYGIVCWSGHGSQTGAYIGYDPDCPDGTLLDTSHVSALNDFYPAFTFQSSCLNGYPENSENLQYALLRQGCIATVAATRVSWGDYNDVYGKYDDSTSISGLGYQYVKRLGNRQTAGQSLYGAKAVRPPADDCHLMDYFDTNVYGDPAVSLNWTTDAAVPTSAASVPYRYTTSTAIPVSWTGTDTGSGVRSYTVQVRDGGGAWANWLTDTTATTGTYTGQAGHTYRFRSIATDWGDNVETDVPADGDAVVTVATARVTGRVTGNRGAAAYQARVTLDPAALNGTATVDGMCAYELFLSANGTYDVSASAPATEALGDAYGSLPPLKDVAVSGDTACPDLVLPPAQDAITNGQFEAGLAGWDYATPLALTADAHTGDAAVQVAYPVGPAPAPSPVLWQDTSINAGWAYPTLSLVYRLSGGNANDHLWAVVTGPTQTISVPLPAAADWTYVWLDLGTLAGRAVTVALEIDRDSILPLTLTVDEISLGPGAVGPHNVFLPLVSR
ncbi:MAG: hypothetical protein KKA73_15330 [Chloroflexi bacterium]|nr:hypothetical protein [Chloroflexota bacterium]MBU1749056.1 hypothetical protein [Chloroflexota bacterium]